MESSSQNLVTNNNKTINLFFPQETYKETVTTQLLSENMLIK
jgi:hypothetical protein